MTGQYLANVEKVRAGADAGLLTDQIAETLDIGIAYVKFIAKKNGIDLPVATSRTEERITRLRELAAEGLTYRQASELLGLAELTVGQYARKYGIKFPHGAVKATATDRTRQMAALYQSGKTLEEIGQQYGVTRERVRQLITKFHDLRATDGGMHRRATDLRAKREAERNARYLKQAGCSYQQYQKLKGKIVYRFNQQKKNAAAREIGWDLNLWQWWSIWEQSGHWAQRGRGQGYVMCRRGDTGPYSVDNVFIATARENCSETRFKKSGLPMGVKRSKAKHISSFVAYRNVNGVRHHLGSHPTPELAYAAYLACAPRRGVAA